MDGLLGMAVAAANVMTQSGNVDYALRTQLEGYQVTDPVGEKQDLRIVASIDSLEYQNVGFTVVVKNEAGTEIKKIEKLCEFVYTELTAIGEEDNKVTVGGLGMREGGYLFALNIQQIPVSEGKLTFEVQSYAIDQNGQTVNGEAATFTHTVGTVA